MPVFRRPPSRAVRIIRDPAPLTFEYVPEEMPHRESQAKTVTALFDRVLQGPYSQTAFFKGPTGTGKTTLAKSLTKYLRTEGISSGRQIDSVHVNCRLRRSAVDVISEIVKVYQTSMPPRGFSVAEQLSTLSLDLKKRQVHLVVVLDEVDFLLRKAGPDLVYQLSRFDEERKVPVGSLSLLLISQRDIIPLLDPPTLSTFKRGNTIDFARYTEEELRDILRQRAGLALVDDVLSPGLLDQIAREAATAGDARFAIEILERAASIADTEGHPEILPEDVRSARGQARSELVSRIGELEQLDDRRLLVLLAACRGLRKKESITTGDLAEHHAVIAEERGIEPLAHSAFNEVVNELDALGYLGTEIVTRGAQGRTAIIRLTDVPVQVLEIELDRIMVGRSRPGSRGPSAGRSSTTLRRGTPPPPPADAGRRARARSRRSG